MGRIGLGELALILLIALVLFGANRLQGLGKALGMSIKEFKDAMSGGGNGDQDPAPSERSPKNKRSRN